MSSAKRHGAEKGKPVVAASRRGSMTLIGMAPGGGVAHRRSSEAAQDYIEPTDQDLEIQRLSERLRRLEEERESKRDLGAHRKWIFSTGSALCEAYQEGRSANWDDSGSAPIPREAFDRAERLIPLLPSGLDIPDIRPAPDRRLVFHWLEAADLMLTVAVGAHENLDFAATIGSERLHGSPTWNGGSLPEILSACFSSFIDRAKAIANGTSA